MDFTALIQMAKQNRETSKDEGKYYKTKLAPPKKKTKESKRLSANIQKFLQKREQEEKERELAQKKKVANLLAMRDEKSKNKIRKMLKVTKSANKSVIDDVSNTQTAVATQGSDQMDQDDYGYVSTAANAFYEQYIEKVKDVKEDKGFAPSRPQSLHDLSGTKDRVKAAITREKDEKLNGQRRSHVTMSSSRVTNSSKTLYDPEAEKREEEKKREEERKAKPRKPQPPPLDFHSLLKLAEKKQHEPIQILQKETRKEPERLLTMKEKKELEEQKRAKEARERRERERREGKSVPNSTTTTHINNKPNGMSTTKMEKSNDKKVRSDDRSALKKPQTNASASATYIPSKIVNTAHSKSNTNMSSKNTVSAMNSTGKPLMNGNTKQIPHKANYNSIGKDPPAKTQPNVVNKQALQRDSKPALNKMPEKPRNRAPIADVRRVQKSNQKAAYKRRIIDDDEDEYDSEMDDFIDDDDEEQDYSSVIKDIFGYDKSK